jgi:hypothetical protein
MGGGMRTLLLALLLVAPSCGEAAETAVRGQEAIAQTLEMRAGMEIRQLRTEVGQHHVLRGEWPEDWSDIRRIGTDPWGNPYVLEIDGSDAIVFSAGPDGEVDTSDDIHAE